MKLVDLVPYLIGKKKLETLYQQKPLDSDSAAILVYMKDELAIESDLRFLRIEDTADEINFTLDGVRFVQLFPLGHLNELTHSDLNLVNKGYSDFEIAQRLFDYRLNDA